MHVHIFQRLFILPVQSVVAEYGEISTVFIRCIKCEKPIAPKWKFKSMRGVWTIQHSDINTEFDVQENQLICPCDRVIGEIHNNLFSIKKSDVILSWHYIH